MSYWPEDPGVGGGGGREVLPLMGYDFFRVWFSSSSSHK